MKDNLEHIFKELENQFDVEEPTIGHFDRFEARLNEKKPQRKFSMLKYIAGIAVAASVLLFIGIQIGQNNNTQGMELASISPEMEETQSYFINTINKELELIEKERTGDTEKIINDGLNQMKKLEAQYASLTIELKESDEDKRIIYAMISNFQQRIDLLQHLLLQIDTIKQLKTTPNEKFI